MVVHKHISTEVPRAFFKSQNQAQNLGPNILEALDVITSNGAKTQVVSKLCESTPVVLAGDSRQKAQHQLNDTLVNRVRQVVPQSSLSRNRIFVKES